MESRPAARRAPPPLARGLADEPNRLRREACVGERRPEHVVDERRDGPRERPSRYAGCRRSGSSGAGRPHRARRRGAPRSSRRRRRSECGAQRPQAVVERPAARSPARAAAAPPGRAAARRGRDTALIEREPVERPRIEGPRAASTSASFAARTTSRFARSSSAPRRSATATASSSRCGAAAAAADASSSTVRSSPSAGREGASALMAGVSARRPSSTGATFWQLITLRSIVTPGPWLRRRVRNRLKHLRVPRARAGARGGRRRVGAGRTSWSATRSTVPPAEPADADGARAPRGRRRPAELRDHRPVVRHDVGDVPPARLQPRRHGAQGRSARNHLLMERDSGGRFAGRRLDGMTA